MKYLISIYCWAVSLLYFIIFLIGGLLLSTLFSPRTYDPWVKARMRFLFKLIFTSVIVEGDRNFESGKAYVFMSNHVSLFDLPLLAGYIPVFFRGVAADYQFKWPLYGLFVRRHGHIAIARENIRSSVTTIKQAGAILAAGTPLTILPEGYRTLDGKLRRFKRLPFHLAKRAGVAIVPIGLSGLYTLKRKESWLINPTTIKIRFGEAIPAETVNSLSSTELANVTREKIAGLIEYR